MPMDVNVAATNNIEKIVPDAIVANAMGLHPPEGVKERTLLLHGNTPTITTVNGFEWVRASIHDQPLNGNVPF
jgi:hypothetical protein